MPLAATDIRDKVVWPKNSCGLALVVLQQSAKPLAALRWTCAYRVLADRRKEQHIVFALGVRGHACACSTNTYNGSTFFAPKLRDPQILQEPAPSRQGIRRRVGNRLIMDAAA